jgi:hypothetical protein
MSRTYRQEASDRKQIGRWSVGSTSRRHMSGWQPRLRAVPSGRPMDWGRNPYVTTEHAVDAGAQGV